MDVDAGGRKAVGGRAKGVRARIPSFPMHGGEGICVMSVRVLCFHFSGLFLFVVAGRLAGWAVLFGDGGRARRKQGGG